MIWFRLCRIRINALALFAFLMVAAISGLNGSETVKIASLTRNYKYPAILVGDSFIYIYDCNLFRIDLYRKQDGKFFKSFGGRGEGPREFKFINYLHLDAEGLFIMAVDKLLRHTVGGDFLHEKKVQPGNYLPVNGRYIVKTFPTSLDPERYKLDFILRDSDFRPVKTVYSTELENQSTFKRPKRQFRLVCASCSHKVYKNRIYIADVGKGFFIAVFDENGKHLGDIRVSRPPTPLTELSRKAYLQRFVAWHGERALKTYEYVFPDSFPAFNDFLIADDTIYCVHFAADPLNDKNLRLTLLDLRGNVLGEAEVPHAESLFYAISEKEWYYVAEDDAEEGWSIYKKKITPRKTLSHSSSGKQASGK